MADQKYTLAELAEAAGVTGRKVRYYIAEGVLPGPVSRGRHARYTEDHRILLGEIQRLQCEGKSLEEIRGSLVAPPHTTTKFVEGLLPMDTPDVWEEYGVAEDVQMRLRGDASPTRRQQFDQALAAARQIIDGRKS